MKNQESFLSGDAVVSGGNAKKQEFTLTHHV
jgi:hypothetical protein